MQGRLLFKKPDHLENYKGPERRRFPRLSIRFMGYIQDSEPGSNGNGTNHYDFDLCKALDIETGGILLEVDEDIDPGTVVDLYLKIYSVRSSPLPIRVKIVSENDITDSHYYYYITFAEIPPPDVKIIYDFVTYHLMQSKF